MNHCAFTGNLGADPEVRHSQSGTKIANFRIGVDDRRGGEKSTEWVQCVVFGKLVDVIQKYVRKGSKVGVVGRMQTRKWQAQDGSDRYSTEIVVNDFEMLDSKRSAADSVEAYRNKEASNAPLDDEIPF